MRYIYTMEYSSTMRKNDMPFTGTETDLEIIIPREVSQKEKDKLIPVMSLICGM